MGTGPIHCAGCIARRLVAKAVQVVGRSATLMPPCGCVCMLYVAMCYVLATLPHRWFIVPFLVCFTQTEIFACTTVAL